MKLFKLSFFISISLILLSLEMNSQSELRCFPEQPDFIEGESMCEIIGDVQYDLIISSNTSASQLSLPNYLGTKMAWGLNILIQGDFFVDQDLTFWGCNVEFWGGAEVFTYSGVRLAGIYSKFYACDYMWQGINVQDNSSVRLTNCHIEDAEIAILADASTSLGIANTTFNRNHIGIKNGAQMGQLSELVLTNFQNNTFTCNARLLPPRSHEHSFAGIVLEYCVAEIGRVNAPNYFNRLHYGIKSDYSSLNVSGCHFSDLRTEDFVGSGIGIDAFDGLLTTRSVYSSQNNGFIGGNSFKKFSTGIFGESTELRLHDDQYTEPYELGIGIASEKNYGSERIEFLRNTFTDYGDQSIGIVAERPVGASGGSGSSIEYNIFELDGISTSGIIQFSNAPSSNSSATNSNIINLNSNGKAAGIRIDVGLAEEYLLIGNEVAFNSTTPINCNNLDPDCRKGFHANGGITKDHYYYNNSVNGLGQYGFFHSHSPNWGYCENVTDGCEIGFEFSEMSDPVRLSNNTIKDHNIGLRIRSNAVIGRQERRNNTWLVDYNHSIYEDWAVQSLHPQPKSSEFITPLGSGPDINPPLVNPPVQLFSQEGGFNNSCSNFPLVSGAEKLLMAGTTASLNQTTANLWDLSYEFLFKMFRNPQIGVENNGAQSYFISMNGTDQKQLAKFTHEYFDLMEVSQTQDAILNTLRDSIILVYDEIIGLDTSFGPLDTFDIDTIFIAQKRSKLHLLIQLNTQLETLQTTVRNDRQAGLNTLLSNVESYKTSTDVAKNQKEVLAISIRRVLNSGLASEEVTLENIARQCSKKGGKAVLLARTLLPRCNAYYFTNFSDYDCIENSNLPTTIVSSNDGPMVFTITPNPVQDQVTLNFTDHFHGKFKIYSLEGKCVLESSLNGEMSTNILVSTLIKGMYTIEIIDEKGIQGKMKFIKL